MAWSAAGVSAHPQMKSRKGQKDEQRVLGVLSPRPPTVAQDLIPLAKKRCCQTVLNEKGDLADEDDLCDELVNNAGEKKRRLTVDQVNFLEMSFNMDLKLEPDRKALIAKELGLQPRQVAIWFQNRRARWKNKQLEQDYEALKALYDAVVQENDTMVQKNKAIDEENKRLQEEVVRLTGILGNCVAHNKVDARAALLDLDSDSDTESALKGGEEQPNSKSELASPTKLDVQSEMLDSLGLSCRKSQEAIVAIVEQPIGDLVACAAMKLEADYHHLSPSDEVFINFPQLVHGFLMDDLLFSYEDQPYGTAWGGQQQPFPTK